jgi:hypothetical protein
MEVDSGSVFEDEVVHTKKPKKYTCTLQKPTHVHNTQEAGKRLELIRRASNPFSAKQREARLLLTLYRISPATDAPSDLSEIQHALRPIFQDYPPTLLNSIVAVQTTDGQMDKQTDRQTRTHRQTHRHTGRHTDRQIDRTHKQDKTIKANKQERQSHKTNKGKKPRQIKTKPNQNQVLKMQTVPNHLENFVSKRLQVSIKERERERK